jgi:hypothetical protein
VAAVGWAVARRPHLWGIAVREVVRHTPSGWWRRSPWLPVPDTDWVRFRQTTATGNPDAPLDPDDVVEWLEWARRFPRQ